MEVESSVTKYESDLALLMRRFVDAGISFEELATWVERHDLHWSSFEMDSNAEKLAIAVMHARWDQKYCSEHPDSCSEYPEPELRERIAEDYSEIFGTKVSSRGA